MTTNNTFSNQKREEHNTFCKTNSQDLTELWRKGELKDGDYYVKTRQGIIIIDYFDVDEFSYDTNHYIEEVLAEVPSYEEWQSLNELLDSMQDTNKALAHKLNNIKVNGNYPDRISKLKSRIKGLTEELEPFTDPYFKGLTTKHISELAKKSIRLTTQHCEDNERIEKLEELLKECRDVIEWYKGDCGYKDIPTESVLTKINEALK